MTNYCKRTFIFENEYCRLLGCNSTIKLYSVAFYLRCVFFDVYDFLIGFTSPAASSPGDRFTAALYPDAISYAPAMTTRVTVKLNRN